MGTDFPFIIKPRTCFSAVCDWNLECGGLFYIILACSGINSCCTNAETILARGAISMSIMRIPLLTITCLAFTLALSKSRSPESLPLLPFCPGYYGKARDVMERLTALDVASLLRAMKLMPSISSAVQRGRFLNPLRDVDHSLRIFKAWIHDKCERTIIWPDVPLFDGAHLSSGCLLRKSERSKSPIALWAVAILSRSLMKGKRPHDSVVADVAGSVWRKRYNFSWKPYI